MNRFLDYKVIPALPKLVWMVKIKKDDPCIEVICGSKVEREKNYFVAGGWDGTFSEAGFDASEVFYGTGAKLSSGGVTLVTPSHSIERVMVYKDYSQITASNSFPFLLEYNGLKLDNKINQYEKILCSLLGGYNKIQTDIPLEGNNTVLQYIVSNITIDFDLNVSAERRRKLSPFRSFDEYRSRLAAMLGRLRENSVSANRKNSSFGMAATISSGYDSPACAVLAKEAGCTRVLSLSGSRYDEDDGSDIARKIGFTEIIRRQCGSYRDKPGCIDAEYISSGEPGTEMQFCVFEDMFADNLVFFGSRGSYWERSFEMTEDFEMHGYFYYETGVSWTENALRNGYIPIPLPAYGASVCNSVKAISNSEEMKPWTLGTKYDKPIPRRIVESAGVSRESFGQKKYGGGFSLGYDSFRRMKKKMTREGYESFSRFRKKHPAAKFTLSKLINKIRYTCKLMPLYINIIFGKLHISARLNQKPPGIANPGAPSDLIFWAVDVMKERYAKAMNG